MSELVPGTPEYQEAYDKEMQRLEAASEPEKEPATTSEEVKPKEPEKTEPDPIQTRVESLEKALKDTKAWGTRTAQQLAELKRERDAEKHASQRPAILDQNPGLEEAIKHVAVKEEPKPPESWLSTVAQAIPDVEQLLGDQAFFSKAQAKRSELGEEWDNPLSAIRELSELKATHLRDKAVQAAIESARKDFDVKSKKRTAMEVPGGSGGGDSTKKEDEVKKVWDMADADFARMRSKVLGYS